MSARLSSFSQLSFSSSAPARSSSLNWSTIASPLACRVSLSRPMPTRMSGQGRAPSAADIESMAREALASLPAAFARHLGDVGLIVEEFADDETRDARGSDDPRDLTGVYHGRPVGEKSSMDSGSPPDRILLYRRAILDEWVEGGEDLATLVRHIVIHEVGHHFGLSDSDMHGLEDEAREWTPSCRHPRESGGPSPVRADRCKLQSWVPALAGKATRGGPKSRLEHEAMHFFI